MNRRDQFHPFIVFPHPISTSSLLTLPKYLHKNKTSIKIVSGIGWGRLDQEMDVNSFGGLRHSYKLLGGV